MHAAQTLHSAQRCSPVKRYKLQQKIERFSPQTLTQQALTAIILIAIKKLHQRRCAQTRQPVLPLPGLWEGSDGDQQCTKLARLRYRPPLRIQGFKDARQPLKSGKSPTPIPHGIPAAAKPALPAAHPAGRCTAWLATPAQTPPTAPDNQRAMPAGRVRV